MEVTSEDTKYLVKVSTKLEITMANYDEDDYDGFDKNEDCSLIKKRWVTGYIANDELLKRK